MNSLRRILIIDDDGDFLIGMRMQLRGIYGVLTATTIVEGLRLIQDQDMDLVLLDVGLEGEDGLEGIKRIHEVHPSVGVAMLSGRRDVKTVVEAIRFGAVDYLTKPVSNDDLAEVVEKAVAARTLQERCEALLRSQMNSGSIRPTIVQRSQKMRQLMAEAEHIKGHRANVLIVGETGVGKELLARHINEESDEGRKRPFIAVNCAAIPDHLLESELFGHEAGAYTGANRRRIGKFELADGGDIFLDEISTMKLDLQVKLLRVLQERDFCRLGSNTPIKADFRVISASNQSLDALVESGSFRADLYHRLRVIQLMVPLLRERLEDIPLLVEHFLNKFSRGVTPKRVTDQAMARLMEYAWPGNVRELANVVQSLVIMTQSELIDVEAFPPWVLNGCKQAADVRPVLADHPPVPYAKDDVTTLRDYVAQAERRYIERVLTMHEGDKSKTARALNMGRTTLYMKLKELGLMK
ncbi:MAG: sigma-54 dependent transcriptional regulator [bacterium]